MMTNHEMATHLWALKRQGLWVNHQQAELVASAARRLDEDTEKMAIQDKAIKELHAEIKELKYRLAEREGIQDEDKLAPGLEAEAPGEAAEDFWEDDWPVFEGD